MAYLSLTAEAQAFIADAIHPGDRVVDATLGNGHDSLFLAQRVGPRGRVFAFDIQQDALETSRQRLLAAGLLSQVSLIRDGHQHLARHLRAAGVGRIAAAMFNLGYLPGGDKGLITRTDNTLRALEDCAGLLQPGGRLSVLCYPGHPGGMEETKAVYQWLERLDAGQWRFCQIRPEQANQPPLLYCCERPGQRPLSD